MNVMFIILVSGGQYSDLIFLYLTLWHPTDFGDRLSLRTLYSPPPFPPRPLPLFALCFYGSFFVLFSLFICFVLLRFHV